MKQKHNSFLVMAVAAALISAFSPPAGAAEGDGLAIDTFRPSTSPGSLFDLVLPTPRLHLAWTTGAVLHYAHTPVRRQLVRWVDGEVLEEANPVKLRLTAELMAAVGLFGFMEVGLAVPVVAYQRGEGSVPGGDLQTAGIGDPRLEVKARFLSVAGFEAGVALAATAPVGHYASSGKDLMGPTGPTVEPRLLGSYGVGSWLVAANVGFLFRQSAYLGGYDQRHALSWNVGAAYDVRDFDEPGGIRIAADVYGEAGINFDALGETPMEALLGVKYRTGSDLILEIGAGPGMGSGFGTPAFRVLAGLVWDPVLRDCPAGKEDIDGFEDGDRCVDPDNDLDGLLDENDECPNAPEDVDGFDDEDGCPDPDNDADGVPDGLDGCPLVEEDRDDYQDEDGCPEEGPTAPSVKITDTQILISSKIYFEFNKAVIEAVSFPILDAVAAAMSQNPQIKVVRVEGHTDNEGTEEYNLELSKARAKAVADYLIGKSVPAERLTSEGYGYTRPKASNTSEEGRAINRRVEFTIVEKE
jgi:outer membrane protein OmpA-like peptidoglycan-associated protein